MDESVEHWLLRDCPVDQPMLGPDLLKDLEQLVTKVQVNLKEAQDL